MQTQSNNRKLLQGLVAALILVASVPLYAKNIQVAVWGNNFAGCGSTSSPCRTIGWAHLIASNNDRIVVEPGIYIGNIIITKQGIKLESVAGHWGTILETGNPGAHVIDIRASKVQIGKKAKGFTVRGASTAGFAGINVDSNLRSGIKIEANLATGNDIGFNLTGDKIQLKSNHVLDTVSGDGISCTDCTKALLQDNVVMNSGSVGIDLNNSPNTSVFRNQVSDPGSTGIDVSGGSSFAKIKDNVIARTSSGVRGITTDSISGEGILLQGNIATENGSRGFRTQQSAGTKGQTIKDNLALGNNTGASNAGIDIDGPVGVKLTITGNSSIQTDGTGDGISLGSGTEIKSFKNNNTYASGSGLGIDNNSGNDFTYSKHFWGNPAGPDPDGADADNHDALDDGGNTVTGSDATKPNAFKAKKAAAL